jgi:protein tyrosine phosphatase (PTP) superfamily phosphohydrolase (DUF442 family)
MELENILNYVQMTKKIATSGQPSVEEIKAISNAGYSTVVNLTPHISQDALPHEGQIVAANFMSYINIPVLYEDPRVDQLQMFFAVMDALTNQKIWIHCVRNNRVSAFVYLYLRYRLNFTESQARSPIFDNWDMDETWFEFMQESIEELTHTKVSENDMQIFQVA